MVHSPPPPFFFPREQEIAPSCSPSYELAHHFRAAGSAHAMVLIALPLVSHPRDSQFSTFTQ